MSDQRALVATPSETVGPFFHFGLTTDPAWGRVAPADTNGEHIALHITVKDGDGLPVPDAVIEIWQVGPAFNGFGRLPTDEEGGCVFHTVKAPHINICLFARGLLRHLHTRVYFDGDPRLADDPALALVPDTRRHTLMARRCDAAAGQWRFDIRLQGDDETVFFDP